MTSVDPLSPEHRAMLERDSLISAAVIAARGYRTVTTKADLKRLGFPDSQANVPTLLIPVFSPLTGQVALYQHRPDLPRVKDGKPLKYETLAGARMSLDVHPSMRVQLGNPQVPLWITEGVKKGDSLVSQGCCTIALLGVWNFRGTNEQGGKTALADWEYIALNGRVVRIVFDSDVMVKKPVYRALVRLAALLTHLGATVYFAYLPDGPGGAKVGVDDYFAQGNNLHDLIALTTSTLRTPPDAEDEDRAPYRTLDGTLVRMKQTKDGALAVPLTNFTASITAQVIEDDGAAIRRVFEVEADLHGRHSVFSVPAEDFNTMNWVTVNIGPLAVVLAGSGTRDHARAAVQLLSDPDMPVRIVYRHTGWRLVDSKWVYLHGGGAVGEDGPVSGVEVRLPSKLAPFLLPEPPTGQARIDAIKASLKLKELGPDGVTGAVLGITYAAPLAEPLGSERPDHVTWPVGPSGVFKTELAALAMAHYGGFHRKNLPASFEDTANSIERTLFILKDALCVVDDFHPAHSRREAEQMAQTATRVLRSVGDTRGRGRMQADTGERPGLPPRCSVIASGEHLPQGQSNNARLFAVQMARGDITAARLTAAQEHVDHLPLAMAAYIQWLAPRLDTQRDYLPTRYRALRAMSACGQTSSRHAREPGHVAHHYLGWEVFTEFAVEAGALSAAEREALLGSIWSALQGLVHEQAEAIDTLRPTARFLALLSDGLSSRRAYLEAKTGGPPEEPMRWGWAAEETPDGNRVFRHAPTAQLLGLVDGDFLLLYPEASYQFVSRAARDAGEVFPVELATLVKRLDEEGLIEKEPGSGRRTPKVRVGTRTVRVIKLAAHALCGDLGEHGEQGEQASSQQSARDVPPSVPPHEPTEAGVGGTGPNLDVPAVPPVPSNSGEAGDAAPMAAEVGRRRLVL